MMYHDERGAVGVMRIGRGTKVLRGNQAQFHFVYNKSHMT
jgi:hypothetical protein